MIDRRILMKSLLAGVTSLALPMPARAAHAGKIIGAIRWDAWYGGASGRVTSQVQAALSPSQYQHRAPACATVVNDHTISLDSCATQAAIDAEIVAAHGAGLDYWAYGWSTDSEMMTAWRFHQASSIKSQMNWCMIWSTSLLHTACQNNALAEITGYFAQSNYQKVLSGRPLIFMWDYTAWATAAADIVTLRAACAAAGVGNPYIVLYELSPAPGVIAATGADAIGFYATNPGAVSQISYSDYASSIETFWANQAASGQPTVPTAVTGWDSRPRIERPMSWEGRRPWQNWMRYAVPGTPSEIAAHVSNMLAFIDANPSSCSAKVGLICSANEHDEEGSTLNPTLGGRAILDAVAGVL